MRRYLLSISLGLLSISLSAQNSTWNERLDSSYIEASRVRPESAIIPIKPADLRMTASPMGEADPVKYIQTLPGVSTGMEGSSAYYVRGGNGGNNLTTLDGIPIYGAGHLLGLTTAYPSDIVSKNDFYAGGFPSDAGGFTSSLLQLTTADGDYQKFHGSFFINNFLAGAQASGPLKKDKVSVLTSVRISPIGLEYNLLRPHLDKSLSLPDKINALAGDAFVKINWKTGSRGRMFFSVFGSYDRYAFDPTKLSSQTLGWSNLMANLSWQQETLSGWKWEARLSHNGFRAFQDQSQSKSVSGKVISTRMSLESALMEEGLEAKVSKQFGYGLEFKTGLDGFVSFFQPGVTKLFQDSEITATTGQPLATFRSSVYGQIRYGNGPFHASAGARLTAFFSEGYKTLKPIASVLVSYQFLPSLLLKATYDHSVHGRASSSPRVLSSCRPEASIRI